MNTAVLFARRVADLLAKKAGRIHFEIFKEACSRTVEGRGLPKGPLEHG
jgi:hypothetical protein